jgi:uncharacterized OB-fold protein
MMNQQTSLGSGVVYTETIVHLAPEAFVQDAPYQVVIIVLDSGGRVTARIQGEPASVGERVDFLEFRNDIPYFKKAI